jgi:TonB-linked SusC/RagA family outer membrane protein
MPLTSYLRAKVPLFGPKLLFLLFFLPLFSAAQLKTISGVVKDETGAAVPNVSVTVRNGTTGTSTDENGRFQISAAVGSTLDFSSVNFEPFSVVVGSENEYNVSLKQKVAALTDVVVVGYGRQKKVNMVGAVGTVNFDEKVNTRALPNASSALSGLVPGLTATQGSGMAGRNGADLLIRGLGTVNNASPLVVVDGMPDVDINRINVNDIETISVLKDATSASVYGSRAANGVILITTKSGKGLKRTSLNFNSNTAITLPTRSFDFMADYPRALHLHQVRASTNTRPDQYQFRNGTIDQWMALGMIDPLRYPNTDWWDIILRNGTFQNYNLSATGGDEKSNFFASIGLKDEEGLQINNDYKQYNARFNFDYKLKSNMNTGIKFTGNWSDLSYALEEGFTDPDPVNTAGFDMQYVIAGITPYDPVSGKFGGVMAYGEDPQAYNPYTLYVNSLTKQNRQEANAIVYWDWTPIKGLTATIDYGLNYYNQFRKNANMPNQAFNFQNNAFGSRVYVGPNAGVSNATNTGHKTLLNGRLNYNTTIANDHEVSALAVYSEEYWYDRFQFSSRNDRLHPSLSEIDAALTDIQSTGGNTSTEGLRSYIGRLNYVGYKKYLFEANFRVDGSSKFLPGSQYSFFPSVAVGWNFTEESFIQSFTDRFLSRGKVRVSYGSLGNNSSVGRYEQQQTLDASNYIIANTISRGFVYSKMINPNLSWETSTVLNAGLELGFLNNRLTAELDYYDRKTTGMIRGSQMSIHLTGAYDAPRANIGDMRNQGVEGTFTWRDRLGSFTYGATLNASYNKTTLEKWSEFIGKGATSGGNNIFIGMPYNFLYSYEDRGIAQTWQDVYNATPQGAAPGDILRVDLNGDGRITGEDRKAYPNIQRSRPTTNFGFNGYAAWKGIDVAFFFQGATGRKDFWLTAFNNVNFNNQRYASTWEHWYLPWSIENREGEWPRLGGIGGNRESTTLWLDDFSYLRFKNLQIGYSIPKRLLDRIHVASLRIAGSAENLATFTSYRGLDPEKQGNGNNLYPINKSYSLSIQLGL